MPRANGTLVVADDHNLLARRDDPSCHPQYVTFQRLGNGGLLLGCPVIVNEAGNPCNPVIRIETDTDSHFIYLNGLDGVLGLAMQGNEPVDRGFNVQLGGPEETVTRRQLLIEGRMTDIFVVSGGYGVGGDPYFSVDTDSQKVSVNVDGDICITKMVNIQHTGDSITSNQNPYPGFSRIINRWTSDVDGRQIRSITAPAEQNLATYPIIDIVNAGSFFITFTHQDGGATAANRIIATANAQPFDLMPGDTCRLWYDATSVRWRVLK